MLSTMLDRAFGMQDQAQSRLRSLPTLDAVEMQSIPGPIPSTYQGPKPGAGNSMEALIPLLLNRGGGGGGGGGNLSSFSAGSGGTVGLAQRIADFITSKPGFSVGGLENYGGMGQISTGHIDNSQHYTGHAGDVSYNGGGRFPNEMAALDWLYNKLNRRWGDSLTELIWRAPDHFDHLHYGTRPGG